MVKNSPHLMHHEYRSDIDGLRAIAVLSVLGFHAFPTLVKGGFVGVDIFFVISGFLISTIIFGGLVHGSFNFIEFYSRRVRRIFPALLVVLLTSLAFGWFALLAVEYKELGKHVAGGAGFISNFLFWNESGYFDNAASTKPLLHLWSLGIEEQFYIAWPLLLWVSWKVRFNMFWILLISAAISFALGIYEVRSDAVAAFYSPQTRFWELVAGAGLAYMTSHQKKITFETQLTLESRPSGINYFNLPMVNGKTARQVQSVLGAALIGVSIFAFTKEMLFPGWWATVPTLGAVLIIWSGPQTWVNRVILSRRLLIWIGLVSFPLYLWHWPLLSFSYILEGDTPQPAIRTFVVLLAFFLAWLTYRFIEKPIRFGKAPNAKAVGLLVLMLITGGLGYAIFQKEGLSNRAVVFENVGLQNVSAKTNPPVPCTDNPKYSLVSKYCTKYVSEHPEKTIVVWGDSSSAAWRTVFLAIAKERNYNVVVISHEGCAPLLDTVARRSYVLDSRKVPYCGYGLIQEQAIDLIKEFKPDVTVLLASWIWLKRPQNKIEDIQSAKTEHTVDIRIRDTFQAFETLSKLIVFKSWPLLPKEPNYQVSRIKFLQGEHKLTVVDVNEFIKDNEYVDAIFKRTASENIVFFSPAKKICSDKCVPIFQAIRMYQDAYHITPQGSMQFKSEIENLLDSALQLGASNAKGQGRSLIN